MSEENINQIEECLRKIEPHPASHMIYITIIEDHLKQLRQGRASAGMSGDLLAKISELKHQIIQTKQSEDDSKMYGEMVRHKNYRERLERELIDLILRSEEFE